MGPFNEGLELFRQRSYDGALSRFSEAVAINPEFCEAHCNVGACLIEKKDYERAIASLDKSIALKPIPPALLHRANAKLFLTRYDDAMTDFNTLLRLDPKTTVAYQNRAVCHLNSGRLGDALSDCNSALDLASANPALLMNRSAVYLQLEELELAEHDLRAALRLSPESVKFRNMLAKGLGRSRGFLLQQKRSSDKTGERK